VWFVEGAPASPECGRAASHDGGPLLWAFFPCGARYGVSLVSGPGERHGKRRTRHTPPGATFSGWVGDVSTPSRAEDQALHTPCALFRFTFHLSRFTNGRVGGPATGLHILHEDHEEPPPGREGVDRPITGPVYFFAVSVQLSPTLVVPSSRLMLTWRVRPFESSVAVMKPPLPSSLEKVVTEVLNPSASSFFL